MLPRAPGTAGSSLSTEMLPGYKPNRGRRARRALHTQEGTGRAVLSPAPAPWESQQQTLSFFLSLTWSCNRALENLMWSRKLRLGDEHSPLAHAGCCWSWKTPSQWKLEGRESAHLHGVLLPPHLLPKTELSHCPCASTSPGSCWMMESQQSCAGYNHLEQLSFLGNKHRHKKSSRVLLHLCAWDSRIATKFCSSVCSKLINRLGIF